ncbi:MAG: hypothetical protein ACK5AN_09875, partial [Planctomyces sp.]
CQGNWRANLPLRTAAGGPNAARAAVRDLSEKTAFLTSCCAVMRHNRPAVLGLWKAAAPFFRRGERDCNEFLIFGANGAGRRQRVL